MLAKSKEAKVQTHIVNAINRIYKNCYYCDVHRDTYVLYTEREISRKERRGCYSELMEGLIHKYIREEDREWVSCRLSREYISVHLTPDKPLYTFEFIGNVTGQNCRCSVLFLNIGEDGQLEHFCVAMEFSGEKKSFLESDDVQKQLYYSELRRSLIYNDLYRDAMLTTGIVVYNFNLTQDIMESEVTQTYNGQDLPVLPVVGLQVHCSYDEYCRRWQNRVSKDTLEEYRRADSCEKLLTYYRAGNRVVSVRYRSTDAVGRELSLQKNVFMEQNTATGDIVGLCYLTLMNHGIDECVDEVTKLENHEAYLNVLNNTIKSGKKIRALKFGIESFSHVNVMYGFECGNQVLYNFARMVQELGGTKFRLYRLTGIKFVCYFEEATADDIRKVYAGIQKIAREQIYIGTTRISLKVYGGAIVADSYDGSADSLRSIGTYALTKSRIDLRGDLVVFDCTTSDMMADFEMLSVIHKSIGQGCRGFYLCYQPIVVPDTEKIVGMEALLRWRGEPYGQVSPNKFIPWLESDPVFYELGNWILRQALTDAMRIKKDHPDFIVNVNVTALQMAHPDFLEDVSAVIKETGFPSKDLCLELTERCRDIDFALLRSKMEYFQSLGIKIAMDDFGTGNASLSLLNELPVDELKVDMSFIRGIMAEPVHQAVVRSIVQCANELELKSCLEGVETKELIDYLQQFCATYYQGYYYSKPVEIDQFMELLQKEN